LAKQLIYQVSVGDVPAFYRPCIESVERYCKRIGADHIVQIEPILRIVPKRSFRSVNALRLGYLPIYEKANAFGYLDRYEQVAIVDADVFVRGSAPDLFAELGDADFAGALERDLPATDAHRRKVQKYSEGQYSLLKDVDWDWNERGAAFYNMGVMLMGAGVVRHLGGTPEQFIRRPEFERFVNGEGHWKWSTDQTLLNYWVKKSGMVTKNLDWKWNTLYGAVPDVSQAYFVHFFLADKLAPGEIQKAISRL
jgi:hypothetical protein